MKMAAHWRYNPSPRQRSYSENLPCYGNTGSIIDPKFSVATKTVAHISWRKGNYVQWANPSIKFPLPEALNRALSYIRVPLSSKDPSHWLSLCQKLTEQQGPDYLIAPRW